MESFNVPTKVLLRFDQNIRLYFRFTGNRVTWPSCCTRQARSGRLEEQGSDSKFLTHWNFITASLMVTADQDSYGEPKHVFLCFVPMFHIMGLSVILYLQLRRGNAVVSMAKFGIDKAVEEYRVTQLFVVPPVMIALAKQSVVNKYDLSSVKLIASGAASLGKELMDETAKNIPQAAKSFFINPI